MICINFHYRNKIIIIYYNEIICIKIIINIIHILEGQKKAQYEECEEEKKKNNEKIQMLKRDIKEMYQIKKQESTVGQKFIT